MFVPRAGRAFCRSNQFSNFHAKESVLNCTTPEANLVAGISITVASAEIRTSDSGASSTSHRHPRTIESSEDHLRRNHSAFWGALARLVTLLSKPSSHSRPMNYASDKKRKKSPEPARKRINLGTPINITAGPLRSRPELDTDPEGNRDRSHRDPELQIDLIRLWRQMTETPGLLGSYLTKRRAKTKVIPPRKHRPAVL